MIKEIQEKHISECVKLIKDSFKTVADEFGFTIENAPGFTAFSMTDEKLSNQLIVEHRPMYALFDEEKIVGFYSLALQDNNECELNNLCVNPAYRHKGVGEENAKLRKWYESYGFVHTGTQKFDFFPFTCGYMNKSILD